MNLAWARDCQYMLRNWGNRRQLKYLHLPNCANITYLSILFIYLLKWRMRSRRMDSRSSVRKRLWLTFRMSLGSWPSHQSSNASGSCLKNLSPTLRAHFPLRLSEGTSSMLWNWFRTDQQGLNRGTYYITHIMPSHAKGLFFTNIWMNHEILPQLLLYLLISSPSPVPRF